MFKYELDKYGKITKFSGTNFSMLGTRIELWKVKDGAVINAKTPQELEDEGLDLEGNKLPTAAELEAEVKAKAEAEKKEAERLAKEALKPENLLQSLNQWADNRHTVAEAEVWGKLSPQQQERNESKYNRAKAGEFADKENKRIIEAYESKQAKFDTHIDLIEHSRTFIKNYIDKGKYKQALKAIEASKTFDMNLTEQDAINIYLELTR